MQAIILAGGKGKRLMPFTADRPKPMVEIGGKPVLQILVEKLFSQDIDDIILCTGYKSEVIRQHFGDGSNFKVRLRYSEENVPLGTAGALENVPFDWIEEDFFLLYGDVIFDMDLNNMMQFHMKKNAIASLALHESSHPYDSDIVEIDADSRISGIKRVVKGDVFRNLSSAALYVLNRSILKHIPKDEKTDFGKDIFPKILNQERVFGYVTEEYIKDMGTYERLKRVIDDRSRGLW